jgi:hypothetical protein
MNERSKIKARLTLLLLLAVVWLLPLFCAGAIGRYFVRMHPRLAFQSTVAGIFMYRTGVWAQMLIQVQRKGAAGWQSIDASELSPMGCFGYRQRLDRILQETQGRQVQGAVMQRLAVWLANKLEEMHPEQGTVTSVRFVQAVWVSNTPELAMPSGHWVSDPPTKMQAAPFILLSAFAINHGNAQLMAKPAHPESAVTKSPSTNAIPPVFRRSRPAETALPAVPPNSQTKTP